MKARRKDTNDEWREVKYVQLENSDTLFKSQYLEFDILSTELKTNEQIAAEAHWQDVRERAAIAAMQGLVSNLCECSVYEDIAFEAVRYADALVKQLKEQNNEKELN